MRNLGVLTAALAGLLLGGCVSTAYRPLSDTQLQAAMDTPEGLEPFGREVVYAQSPALAGLQPDCVALWAAGGGADPVVAGAVERHARMRFARVVPADRTRDLERALAVDLAVPGDRAVFAGATGCGLLLAVDVLDRSRHYLMVWSEARLGLSLTLTRVADGAVLWRAAHIARRGDGGLPLSPVSLASSVFSAGRFQNDAEVMETLAEDAVRRMVRTLDPGT